MKSPVYVVKKRDFYCMLNAVKVSFFILKIMII